MLLKGHSMKLRTTLLATLAAAALAATTALTFAAPASAATLTEVTGFGTNPSNIRMHIYVPDRVAARPGIVVAVHYCGGSGPGFHSQTGYAGLADRYGFIVIYPSVTRSSGCWDVSSPAALRRGGGSDPVGIASMVSYTQQRYNADPNRVFVTGSSSGAMMTNVLLGDYPDVFKAGASFAGVPFGCFATTNGSEWNSQCSGGQLIRTPQQWGDLVRNAYPGYTGARPRMQIWHGTNDETLRYPNFGEQVKQWTNVHGLSQTPSFTDTPQSNYTRTRYGGTGGMAPVEAISMQGVSHSIPIDAAQVIRFFGLDSSTPPTGAPPTSTPPTSTPPTGAPPTGGPGGCTATVSVNQWTGGFVATVRVTAGSSAINGWRVTLTLPSGSAVTNSWSANRSAASGTIQWTNVDYNGRVAAGQSTEFGFQASGSGAGMTPTCTAS
jgi:acetylxylan esterase